MVYYILQYQCFKIYTFDVQFFKQFKVLSCLIQKLTNSWEDGLYGNLSSYRAGALLFDEQARQTLLADPKPSCKQEILGLLTICQKKRTACAFTSRPAKNQGITDILVLSGLEL
jgi:hypothetical protein